MKRVLLLLALALLAIGIPAVGCQPRLHRKLLRESDRGADISPDDPDRNARRTCDATTGGRRRCRHRRCGGLPNRGRHGLPRQPERVRQAAAPRRQRLRRWRPIPGRKQSPRPVRPGPRRSDRTAGGPGQPRRRQRQRRRPSSRARNAKPLVRDPNRPRNHHRPRLDPTRQRRTASLAPLNPCRHRDPMDHRDAAPSRVLRRPARKRTGCTSQLRPAVRRVRRRPRISADTTTTTNDRR